ncbi:MAG: 2-oxoacid:acceptor oxidoreductase subunit alpha [Euryarchaeota archaeon]|nr:2-oxoacid:acceptor oxidoreductase subunit alpha [Euryarchaeota archaeon]
MTDKRRKSTTIRLAGESGEGVVSSGQILTDALIEQGFAILTYQTFPAEIKGGHCWYQVRGSAHPLDTPGDRADILVSFNQEGFDTHIDDLRSGGLIIYDSDAVTPVDVPKAHLFPVPIGKIAADEVGSPRSKNVLAAAILARLLGLPEEELADSVTKKFKHKGAKVVEVNVKAVTAAYGLKLPEVEMDFALTRTDTETAEPIGAYAMTGNDALVLGALVGGCKFFAGYPITPASTILEAMMRELPAWGGSAIQAEDEMSALTHCLGASFAGAKVMTATSGPGFSLMIELLGHASTVELPVVIVDAQRGGPSTGLPTKYEQSDLNAAVYSGHGDTPRIVLAPSTVRENFDLTVKAFNLAEHYQVPVILLTDNALATRLERVTLPDLNTVEVEDRILATPEPDEKHYKRYKFTENGVSPFPVPGTPGGMYVCEGLEHDETGKPNYTGENHVAMNNKRYGKLEDCARRETGYYDFGAVDPDLVIVGWGAIAGTVREAVDRLTGEGLHVGGTVITMLSPFPLAVRDRLRKAKKVLVVEGNYTGQLAQLIEAYNPIVPEKLAVASAGLIPVESVEKVAKRLLNVQEVQVRE